MRLLCKPARAFGFRRLIALTRSHYEFSIANQFSNRSKRRLCLGQNTIGWLEPTDSYLYRLGCQYYSGEARRAEAELIVSGTLERDLRYEMEALYSNDLIR